jgi:hypothetical protein
MFIENIQTFVHSPYYPVIYSVLILACSKRLNVLLQQTYIGQSISNCPRN